MFPPPYPPECAPLHHEHISSVNFNSLAFFLLNPYWRSGSKIIFEAICGWLGGTRLFCFLRFWHPNSLITAENRPLTGGLKENVFFEPVTSNTQWLSIYPFLLPLLRTVTARVPLLYVFRLLAGGIL